jgi:hypothetical protein
MWSVLADRLKLHVGLPLELLSQMIAIVGAPETDNCDERAG